MPDAPAQRRSRVETWLDSDLVGIPATLYTFAVLAVSLAVFKFVGGVAGMIVAVALWIPMVVFAIRGRGRPVPSPGDFSGPTDTPHRVLVLANRGLDDPALCAEVCRRTERTAAEAMVVAPVTARSRLRELADDVDEEMEAARRRLEAAVRTLRRDGVQASGRVNAADPMESLLDGLREFHPNEVVMLPSAEADWSEATGFAERVRAEAGLPVTVVAAAGGPPEAESALGRHHPGD